MSRFRIALAGLATAAAAAVLIPSGIAQAGVPVTTHAPVTHLAAVPGTSASARKAPAGNTAAASRIHPDATYNGCPSGDVCMYTTSGWDTGTPEHKYYHYTCDDLSNELGTRVIYNVQTGGATVTGYKNSGCSDPAWTYSPSTSYGYVVNITPINSISLNP